MKTLLVTAACYIFAPLATADIDDCSGPPCYPAVEVAGPGNYTYSLSFHYALVGGTHDNCEAPCVPCGAGVRLHINSYQTLWFCPGGQMVPTPGADTGCVKLAYNENHIHEIFEDCAIPSGDVTRNTVDIFDYVGTAWVMIDSASVTCSCDD